MTPTHPSFHRRTSSYRVSVLVEGDPNPVADALIAACPVEVEQSGVNETSAFIRFRASSPGEATRIAGKTWSGTYTLSLGYGAHFHVIDPSSIPSELADPR